jgi:predicted Zn finger-like uncharacterized protein
MALATRCPHCHTTFRVAHDQLKLRAGLVRCGACKEIFNGIEHLLSQEALTATLPASSLQQPAAPAEPSASSPPASPAPAPMPLGESTSAETPPQPETAPIAPAASETDNALEAEIPAGQKNDAAAIPVQAPNAPVEQPKPEPDFDIPDFAEFLKLAEAASEDAPKDDAPEKHGIAASPASTVNHDETPATQAPDETVDPLTRMTLMDFHERQEFPQKASSLEKPAGKEADLLEQTIDELQSKPERRKSQPRHPRNMGKHEEAEPLDEIDAAEEAEDISHADETDEPSFVKKARFQERFGPLITWTLAIGSVLLTLALLGQGIYAFRNQLAARLPKAKPALIKACTYLGCRVTLPMQIEAITIEANELQTTGASKDTFVLTTVLRNRSPLTQTWPNLELTLKDANGKPLVRRVFLPRDYLLDAQDIDRGFAPATEQQIKLVFALAQPDSSGYEVAIFYP